VKSLEQILEDAHALFQQRVAQNVAANNARQAEEEKQIARERAELREWLVQFIPSELMQYVDTSDYSHNAAQRMNSGVPNGIVLEVSVPGAAPIRVRVQYWVSKFNFQPLGNYQTVAGFVAPSNWKVVNDDGCYVTYSWSNEGSRDFMLALGAAVDFWREHGAAIESALAQKTAEWKTQQQIAEATVPVTREGLSLDERQVLALEAIAAALETMAYNAS